MNNELPLFHSNATPTRLIRSRSLRPAVTGRECVPHADPADLARDWPAGMSAMIRFCPRHPRHPTSLVPIPFCDNMWKLCESALKEHPGAGLVILSTHGEAYISGGFTMRSLDKTLLIAEGIGRMRDITAALAAKGKADERLQTRYPNHNLEAAAILIHEPDAAETKQPA
jgi:hypothetical protein